MATAPTGPTGQSGPDADPHGVLGAPPLLCLPTAPYPGLRPFLDHEDMLMHGRQAQVADIVHRLGRQRPLAAADNALPGDAPPLTRFVAVIGGSGSGKSSLIRAGVVPFLRQYGIPEAGDLWEAIVTTPGTNFQPDADGRLIESPITRLARKVERVLRGGFQPERCEAIEQTLRRPGGLGLMVDTYGRELNLPAGVVPETACVLVVIDQFEELFHKTNSQSADAQLLVDRVIDHYHQSKTGRGSARCFLAITMRSEHLNDCAGYLGLPEAINAGSYLVSRLDDAQVREVIEKPAQRYLRLHQRERQALARQPAPGHAPALPELPRTVVFDPLLVQRLIDDTRALAHDPDHLPLLQHALARTWGAALTRLKLPHDGVPDAVTLPDLWHAALADAGGGQAPAAGQNVLQLSLDHWAEQAFLSHPVADQLDVLALMRRLAYKDTRTGTYNQQRLYVGRPPLMQARIHELVRGRWILNVDYLYWDDEDPARVTLKVSHESFIRGWNRLRKLADDEAWRLEQYMALLAATERWVEKGHRADDLLDQRLLGLLHDARIDEALGTHGSAHDAAPPTATWQDWQRWLAQLPQGQALQAVSLIEVRRFVRSSHQRQVVAAQRGKRATRTIAVLGALVGVTLLFTGFSIFVQQPVADRSRLYFDAASLANRATLRNAYPDIGGSQHELAALLEAASQLRRARSAEGKDAARFAAVSDLLLQSDWSPLKALRLANLLPEAARTVEPSVNGKLRALLTRSVWRTPNVLPTGADQLIDSDSSKPLLNINCDLLTGVLKPVEGRRQDDDVRRGVFVSKGSLLAGRDEANTRNNLMYTATLRHGSECTLGKQLQALPADREPAVMFDALLGHLLLAVDSDVPGAPATVSISRMRWDDPDAGGSAEIHQPLAVVFNNQAAERLRRQVPQSVGMAGATWRMPGGRAIRVDDEAWRINAENGQRMVPQPAAVDLRPLVEDPADRRCEAIRQAVLTEIALGRGGGAPGFGVGSAEADVQVHVYPDGAYCLALLRVPLPGAAVGDDARHQVNVRAYARPSAKDLDLQHKLTIDVASVASFEFGRVRASENNWFVGQPGSDVAGWLMIERKTTQEGLRYTGAPWSTDALLQLGAQVLKAHQAIKLASGSGTALPGGPPVGAPPVGAPPVGGPPLGAPPVGAPPIGAAPAPTGASKPAGD